MIVGRLDVFFGHEHPESLAKRQQVLAERRDRGIRAAASPFEKSIELSNDRQKSLNQLLARNLVASAAETMPGFEDPADELESVFADGGAGRIGAASVNAFLKVAFEVGPANLSAIVGPLVVSSPSIADDEAADRFAQENRQGGEVASCVNHEGDRDLRGSDPEPTALARLLPAGFIDVLDRSRADCFERLLVSRGESFAHLLFESGHRAQRDGDAEDVLGDFFEAAFADVMAAGEIGKSGGESRADAVSAEFRGDGGLGDFAAGEASPAMALILGDDCGEFGKFGDLMPARSGIVGRGVLRQRGLAGATALRREDEEAVDSLGRQKLFQMRRMPGLSARFAMRFFLLHRRRRRGRICRRRNRRVGGVLVELLKQIAHERFEFRDSLLKPNTSWTLRAIHAASLANGRKFSCARFCG